MVSNRSNRIIIPAPLSRGDIISIVSPAGAVNNDYIHAAAEVLSNEGWKPVFSKHCEGQYLNYSGSLAQRLEDLTQALTDKEVKAIFCARGGFGAVQLLEGLKKIDLRKNAKWLIGYSDISALHALFTHHSIISLHAPMAKHLSRFGGKDEDSKLLFSILRGKMPSYKILPNVHNREGETYGKIIGGNLAVISSLISTPFQPFEPGCILFIEDISEPVYKVERIFWQLKYSGILQSLNGLIVGNFTNYSIKEGQPTMEEMISSIVRDYDFPVAMGVPIGHTDHNIPIPVSANASFIVTNSETVLDFSAPGLE